MKAVNSASFERTWLCSDSPIAITAGTIRSKSLNQTRARLEPLLAKCGITRVAELTGLDITGVPVYSAVRPSAATLTVSAGKGLNSDSAWISAVMESLEVRAAELFLAHNVIRDCAANLDIGYSVLDLNLHPASLVDDGTVLDWTTGKNLTNGKDVLVPSAAIGLRGWTSQCWAPPMFVTTSNGLAAGNDPVEATIHGLLELVERDALSRADRKNRAIVSTRDIGKRLADVFNCMDDIGATVQLEQLQSLAGTSTFMCYLSQMEMPHLFGGSGCHVDPQIAIERALLEAMQSRASVISGLRDDIPAWTYHGWTLPTRLRSSHSDASVVPPLGHVTFGHMHDTLSFLVEHISRHTGFPVFAVNLTARDEPFPAIVQVFAPGLQPAFDAPTPLGEEKVLKH